jgi:hypothetical protein
VTGKRMVVITDGETFTHRVYIDDLFGAIDKPGAVHCQLPIVGAQRGASFEPKRTLSPNLTLRPQRKRTGRR